MFWWRNSPVCTLHHLRRSLRQSDWPRRSVDLWQSSSPGISNQLPRQLLTIPSNLLRVSTTQRSNPFFVQILLLLSTLRILILRLIYLTNSVFLAFSFISTFHNHLKCIKLPFRHGPWSVLVSLSRCSCKINILGVGNNRLVFSNLHKLPPLLS